MPINPTMLNALKQIVSQYGGVETLSDARRVKAMLSDLAAGEPKPQKNAIIACIELGYPAMLQNAQLRERGQAKAKLAERLNLEEGLDLKLCADTLDMLEAALFEAEKNDTETKTNIPDKKFCMACGTALPIEARFCYACGGAVASGAVSETPKAPASAVSATPEKQPAVTARPAPTATAEPTATTPKAPAPAGGYYLSINYQQSGPFTLEQLKSMAGGGSVSKKHWVRNGDKSDWLPVTNVSELQPFFADTGSTGGKGSVTQPATSKNQAETYGAKPQPAAPARQNSGAWRELQVLEGHTGYVYSVAYSPDGSRIASGSGDKAIKIWDAESGRELQVLEGHTDNVISVAYSPDGSRIASGSGNKTIKIWDVESGGELLTLKRHTDSVFSVAYSPDGLRIASASNGLFDNSVKIWDAESGQKLETLKGHKEWVSSVAYSPNGRRIAAGSDDHTVRIWDTESGQELLTLRHTNNVKSVAYSPDGRRIAAGLYHGGVNIWDAESGRKLQTLKGHTYWVSSVAYSPDGRRIASGSDDNTIKIWDTESGRELQTLKGHTGPVKSVVYSPDGRRIASGSDDNTIKIWGRE
jgi:WD40 repeat protein/ribosomal protein L40E